MPQLSIPFVAHFYLDCRPARVDPALLVSVDKIPPEQYSDDEHHLSVYCPECGVMCNRRPRKTARRIDNVQGTYAHIRGYDDVSCPNRKSADGAGTTGVHRDKKAVNLLTLSEWKSGEEDGTEDEDAEHASKPKRVVQKGTAGNRQGVKLTFDADESVVNAGKFHTVRRLVQVAFESIDTYINLPDQETTRLGEMFMGIEKIQRNSEQYLDKSFLFFGQPLSILVGDHYVFFNFKEHGHHLAMRCSLIVYQQLRWKTSERNYCYVFYGLLEKNDNSSFVLVTHLGQICRVSESAAKRLETLY